MNPLHFILWFVTKILRWIEGIINGIINEKHVQVRYFIYGFIYFVSLAVYPLFYHVDDWYFIIMVGGIGLLWVYGIYLGEMEKENKEND